jgi:hypothetical protein
VRGVVLAWSSHIDWKEALAVQKEIKRQMQLDYQRTGRGRPHIERADLAASRRVEEAARFLGVILISGFA